MAKSAQPCASACHSPNKRRLIPLPSLIFGYFGVRQRALNATGAPADTGCFYHSKLAPAIPSITNIKIDLMIIMNSGRPCPKFQLYYYSL